MSTTPALGKAKAYLDVQFGEAGRQSTAARPATGGPFVTVSREAGAGGSTFARALIAELNKVRLDGSPVWTLYDGNLIEKVLADANLPERLAQYLPEDRIPEIAASVGEILGLHPDLWTLVHRTNETIKRLSKLGHAVIVGRGANFAAEGVPNGFSVRLVGSPVGRAHRMAAAKGCSIEAATGINRKLDAARRDYVRSAFDRDGSAPEAYDLVINTVTMTTGEAVETVLAVLVQRGVVLRRP